MGAAGQVSCSNLRLHALRIGLACYTDDDDVDRLLEALSGFAGA